MATSIANARVRQDLKRSGDRVLKREGVTFTGAVNALYEYLVREQKVPDCLNPSLANHDEALAKRRDALRDFTGCVSCPEDFDLDSLRSERLARQ